MNAGPEFKKMKTQKVSLSILEDNSCLEVLLELKFDKSKKDEETGSDDKLTSETMALDELQVENDDLNGDQEGESEISNKNKQNSDDTRETCRHKDEESDSDTLELICKDDLDWEAIMKMPTGIIPDKRKRIQN